MKGNMASINARRCAFQRVTRPNILPTAMPTALHTFPYQKTHNEEKQEKKPHKNKIWCHPRVVDVLFNAPSNAASRHCGLAESRQAITLHLVALTAVLQPSKTS